MPLVSKEAKQRRKEKRDSKGRLFCDGTPVTTENIFVKLMLNREGALPSALQIAVCRAIDGISLVLESPRRCVDLDGKPVEYPAGFDLWDLPQVQIAFGNGRPPECRTALFANLSAVRCGKSQIAAAKALEMIEHCDFSQLAAGDMPMLPIFAPDMKAAKQTWNHIYGTIDQSPTLRKRFARPPRGDSLFLYHPSGRVVEVPVRALSRFGTTVTSRWCVGVIWDEAPRMIGAADGAKNLTESLRAARGRILRGGMLLLIGSPSHPYGPVFEYYTTHFGRPDEDVIIVKARGSYLNPAKWTEKEERRMARQDPDGHRTDCLAEFGDPQEAFFSSDAIDRNRRRPPERPEVLPYDPACSYVAAMDPAGRVNAWTLIVLARLPSPDMRERYAVAIARQWKAPRHRSKQYLDADAIFAETKSIISAYGLDSIHTDQYAPESQMALGTHHGMNVVPHDMTVRMQYEAAASLRVILDEDRLELAPDPNLREDLVRVQKRFVGNNPGVFLQKTTDGRHCDFFPSLALCALFPPEAADSVDRPLSDEEKMVAYFMKKAGGSGDDAFTEQASVLWQ